MSKQAWVGLFTLLGICVVFGIFYVLSDYGTRSRGYKVGVHFESAAGLRPGALVYLSGVPVGTVDTTRLQPDYTVDVILAVNPTVDIPRSSKFIINAPLTGDPILLIVPPRKPDASLALLPKHVLPLIEQPQGTNPATLEDLLEQGQGEIKKVDLLLNTATRTMPQLLGSLQSTLDNANKLTVKANIAFDGFTSGAQASARQLQGTLDRVSRNFDDMSSTLDLTVKRNSTRFDALITSLTSASSALASTVNSLHDITGDPRMHENIVSATHSLAGTTAALEGLASNLRDLSGNPQTQAQLRDAFANLDASSQRLNSLLGSLGGRSSVTGVDTGAMSAPATMPISAPPSQSQGPTQSQQPAQPQGSTQSQAGAQSSMRSAGTGISQTTLPAGIPPTSIPPGRSTSQQSDLPPNVRLHMEALAARMINVQLRLSELSKQDVPTATQGRGSPLLTSDQGPQTDLNVGILPHSSTSFLVGANDLGAQTTYNLLGEKHLGAFGLGGGVLYSRLGVTASGQNNHLGFETRLYDPRNLTLDTYGRFILGPHIELFGGERDVFHADRRTVFGLQATVP